MAWLARDEIVQDPLLLDIHGQLGESPVRSHSTFTEHTGSQEWAQGLKADGVPLTLLRRGVILGWKNGIEGGSRRGVPAHRCEGSEMQVAERMGTAVVRVRPSDSVRTALKLLGERQIRHLPVVEDGRLVGIVTDRDIRLVFPSAVNA